MRRVGLWAVAMCVLALLVLVPLYVALTALACGIERWPVKTLADAQAAQVMASQPTDTTISALTDVAPPDRATLMHAISTRFPQELKKYRVSAVLVGYKRETDSDFHIVLADPDNPKVTMVAEIPSPDCVPPAYNNQFAREQAMFASDFGKPTTKYKKLAKPIYVRVEGIFFFDFIHGQTGVAKNGAELHPVTKITQ